MGTSPPGRSRLRSTPARQPFQAVGERSGLFAKGTENWLITDRASIRDDPPDILFTNHRMLDQLLLRSADQKRWEKSAESLTFLALLT